MRRLNRSRSVTAPSAFALAYIGTYFLERGPQSKGAELALRFTLPCFFVEGLTIEKRVVVRINYGVSNNEHHPLTIAWQPLGTGPLPNFDGTLVAEPVGAACRLTIAGSYTPPGGTLGGVFDTLIGVRIANATMDALLEQLAQAIERDYARRSVA